jgi:voltage-gated potassium channel
MAGGSRRHPRRRTGLERRVASAVGNRRSFAYLAGMTAVLGLGVGFVMRLLDKQDFHSYGDGVWWAVVTLGTVGYGDIVPHTGWGRVLGSVVIVTGVTFIAFLTATVTSLFVTNELELRDEESDDGEHAELHRIEQRLEAIEAALAKLTETDRR